MSYIYPLLDQVEQNIVICRARADQLFADAEGKAYNYAQVGNGLLATEGGHVGGQGSRFICKSSHFLGYSRYTLNIILLICLTLPLPV
jgi:hypothetical protein